MTDRQIQAIIDTLQNQRNGALNTIVQMQGDVTTLQDEIENLKGQVANLKNELGKMPITEELPEATIA